MWAPKRKQVEVVSPDGQLIATLQPEGDGYFSGEAAGTGAGTLYRYRLDAQGQYADPASRFQPDGPHGPSAVVDPSAFEWTDAAWRGSKLEGQVVYEMHIGTFTSEGTWASAQRQLEELAGCGITLLEVMPVADFPGRFGWGYDGVGMFAPTWLYGEPDDMRRFVDRAHGLGLGVILDVVYNHLGPDGNYLREFSDWYFTSKYNNEWGDAINFDGEHCEPVREFFIANARYWIDEFHLDGLRLDATQAIFDDSREHILLAITRAVRGAARGRSTVIVGENEPQRSKLVRPAKQGGYELDALWNDDFHHSAMVALTGRREAYYTDYYATAQEFVSMVKYGFLYQGQFYSWQKNPRGAPSLDIEPARFVLFIQNHDQVANSLRGWRVHQLSSPARFRVMTALFLLAPGTPMLFQGQEFGASSPFFYFADQNPELSKKVREGRAEFLSQFPSIQTPEAQECLTDPGNPATFERSKLDFGDRERNRPIYDLHKDLLRLRREDPVLRQQRRGAVDGAVLGPDRLVLRWFGGDGDDRLLLVCMGVDGELEMNEPLLAPPEGRRWRELWSSESCRYAGSGSPGIVSQKQWRMAGESAILLAAEPESDA
ncbi:MAG: malto-oligosyltrehalose trehalohydrolase [Bryobacteraceae bacterium]|nr:malto-oligosyltrehalose trehalohydrolase [Bryobacteraceae bacterium]